VTKKRQESSPAPAAQRTRMRPDHHALRSSSLAVIADDFTGAAEIGGVAVRYGLAAEVQTAWTASEIGVIAVDADTRSLPAREAAQNAGKLAEKIGISSWVYKKIDSVLRGPVVAEIEAVLEALGKRRALLVPANPSLGRVIRGGCYFIDGEPIDKTDFGKDPEYPAMFSDVRKILGTSRVVVLRPQDALPERGIILGEAASVKDVTAWAQRLDDHTLPAGAAEFFARILETRLGRRADQSVPLSSGMACDKALFVCGSASAQSRMVRQEFERRSLPVLFVPQGRGDADTPPADLLQMLADAAASALASHSRVLLCLDQHSSREGMIDDLLYAVERLLGRSAVDHLYVEGGSTASALIRRLGWRRMRVDRELAPGVVSLEVRGERRLLTVKPGSYRWPDVVWKQ
jgi:D-threonate/D-erythronate kinase